MVRAAKKNTPVLGVTNEAIADALVETARLLEQQGANPFRVRAYRHGADAVRNAKRPVAAILKEKGQRGLMRLPGIGDSLAESINKITRSGRLPILERLRNDNRPESVFTTVADIGPKLAVRIHDELGISTLTELHAAAWDGRLAKVAGMGEKRVRAVRESLAGRLNRPFHAPSREPARAAEDQPSVGELLDIDREYRELAEKDRLLRVAPRRFNPTGEAWLPILHTERNGRRFSALYSNTSRAHELGALRDWVVIYRDDQRGGAVWTVITSRLGRLKGRRVVRGREKECQQWYDNERTQLELEFPSGSHDRGSRSLFGR